MTGCMFDEWFEDGEIDLGAVAASMRDFESSDAIRRFEPGSRYFFGSPIPAR